MGYLPGENINLGLGKETTRGTAVSPTLWLAGRTPTGLNVMNDKTVIQETKGTRSASKGSVITEQRAEGDIEFNVKNTTIVPLLRSLLGSVSSASNGGSYDHTITPDVDEVQAPSYTFALSRPGQQDYEYNLGVITSLELNATPDDLVYAVAQIMAKSEAEHADYSPSFTDEDHHFPHQNVSVKFADTVGDLSGEDAICINELALSIVNNASVKRCLSSLAPNDILANLIEVTGSLTIDLDGKVYHDLYKNGTYKAMEITIENTAVDIGSGSEENPKIVITLPKVSFEGLTEDRPIDSITSESIEFMAHYDDTEAKQIEVVVTNETSSF